MKHTMCPNPECPHVNEKRNVMGGCECGTALIPWTDPNEPTIEQIAFIVCDVAEMEGKSVPRPEIERILRGNTALHREWLQRLSGIDWKRRLSEIHIVDTIMGKAL